MISDNQEFESFLPVYDAIPEKWEDSRPFIVEQLKRISNAVNVREIGFFIDEEVLSGKAFIPTANLTGTSQQFRQVLRKVIDFGPLPDNATKSVPHEIMYDANFTLIQLWASATNPVALQSVPIPYVSQNANNEIQIFLDATNVNIVTANIWSAYTRCFVIIEYMQEL